MAGARGRNGNAPPPHSPALPFSQPRRLALAPPLEPFLRSSSSPPPFSHLVGNGTVRGPQLRDLVADGVADDGRLAEDIVAGAGADQQVVEPLHDGVVPSSRRHTGEEVSLDGSDEPSRLHAGESIVGLKLGVAPHDAAVERHREEPLVPSDRVEDGLGFRSDEAGGGIPHGVGAGHDGDVVQPALDLPAEQHHVGPHRLRAVEEEGENEGGEAHLHVPQFVELHHVGLVFICVEEEVDFEAQSDVEESQNGAGLPSLLEGRASPLLPQCATRESELEGERAGGFWGDDLEREEEKGMRLVPSFSFVFCIYMS